MTDYIILIEQELDHGAESRMVYAFQGLILCKIYLSYLRTHDRGGLVNHQALSLILPHTYLQQQDASSLTDEFILELYLKYGSLFKT